MTRLDASPKASGELKYLADLTKPDLLHVAVARSTFPHAEIVGIDDRAARAFPGVVGVFTARDMPGKTYGRLVCDVPILAREKVRYVGERVAAVVARTRGAAEAAADLIEVSYRPLPSVDSIDFALRGVVKIHDEPWTYPNSLSTTVNGHHVQAVASKGDMGATEQALRGSAFVVDETYTTPAVHQGYLETQACMTEILPSGQIKLWSTHKGILGLRALIAGLFDVAPELVEIQPVPIGGDFGGKGSPGDAPLCVALAKLVGGPVKMVLRYDEELGATNPRHGSRTRVRLGCDAKGNLVAAIVNTVLDGGAYAGYNPDHGPTHGSLEAPAYRVGSYFTESQVMYTNRVPKGNMRAPGAPQLVFAFESALDELAFQAKIDPIEMRRKNLLETGDLDDLGHRWREFRGVETLEACLSKLKLPTPSNEWMTGFGIGIYNKRTQPAPKTSLRLVSQANGRLRVEVPVPETGTSSHSVVRNLIAKQLGYDPANVDVIQVSSGELPSGLNTGGSRVTATIAVAVDAAVEAWQIRTEDSVTIEIDSPPDEEEIGSYVVQIAQVAVDPDTGQLRVVEIISAIDVAKILRPAAFQMQIDGGTGMGFGFGCLEDLDERDGQVRAANLGEFKIASIRDIPLLTTVLVTGGIGVGTADVKNIGESTTPPTAAAVANAVFAATGCRIRDLPITSERIYAALCEQHVQP